MTTRALVLFGTLGALALTPAAASAQSPFEGDDAVSPPPSTNTKNSSKNEEDDDEDEDEAPPPPRRHRTKSTSRMFEVVDQSKVTIHLVSPDPGATFSIQSGSSASTISTFGTSMDSLGRTSLVASTGDISSARFDRVCTAPCTVKTYAGVQRWQLELPDGRSAVTNPLLISRNVTMEARYESNSGARFVLGLLGTLTLVTGAVLNGEALGRRVSPDSGLLWLGLGSDLLGLFFFEMMVHTSDSVEVREM